MKEVKLLLLGLATGVISSALGVGGGIILISVLTLFFGYHLRHAMGISLNSIPTIVMIGVMMHLLINPSNVYFGFGLYLMIGSIVGALIGIQLEFHIRKKFLKILFVVLLLAIGLRYVGVLPQILSMYLQPTVLGLIFWGLGIGILAGLLGIGGGGMFVPLLNLAYGLPLLGAIATSLLVELPTTLAAGLYHQRVSGHHYHEMVLIVPGALIGAILGALLANKLPDVALRYAFGLLLLIAGVKMWMRKEQSL